MMLSFTPMQVFGHFLALILTSLSAKVRLSGTGAAKRGRVEIYHNGVWGTVCDNGWDIKDAHVVCRMLGYRFALQASCCGKYGRGTGKIWLGGVHCTGREDTLFSCSHGGWGVHSCGHYQDAGVFCSNSTARLANGKSRAEGRVELLYNGSWGTVCGNNWDLNDAHVVCRMMGYSGAVESSCCAKYGQGSGQILLDNVQCHGDETNLLSCSHGGLGTNSCQHSQDAGVTCSVPVRLRGGKSSAEGVVELYYDNLWRTVHVCNSYSYWARDKNDNVACRMLGFTHSLDTIRRANLYYGKESEQSFLDEIQCGGNEKTLASCRWKTFNNRGCTYIGLTCSNSTVRIVGGKSSLEGRVEIYHNEIWRSICNKQWTMNDAQVVCRMLGYSNALHATLDTRYGTPSGSTWLNNVSCSGRENSLMECQHKGWGNHGCGYGGTPGVFCSVAVRLMNGGTKAEGRVELYYSGVWGTVCDTNWDLRDADVVCRMLGYGRVLQATRGSRCRQSRGTVWLYNVQCRGIEKSIETCSHKRWGQSHRWYFSGWSARVICDSSSEKIAWSVWTAWSLCSTSCGTGQRTRMRTCDRPTSADGGASCIGQARQSKSCAVEFKLCHHGAKEDPTEKSRTNDRREATNSDHKTVAFPVVICLLVVVIVVLVVVLVLAYRRQSRHQKQKLVEEVNLSDGANEERVERPNEISTAVSCSRNERNEGVGIRNESRPCHTTNMRNRIYENVPIEPADKITAPAAFGPLRTLDKMIPHHDNKPRRHTYVKNPGMRDQGEASDGNRTYTENPGVRDQGRKSGVDHTYLKKPGVRDLAGASGVDCTYMKKPGVRDQGTASSGDHTYMELLTINRKELQLSRGSRESNYQSLVKRKDETSTG